MSDEAAADPVALNQWYAVAALAEIPHGRVWRTELLGAPISLCVNGEGEPLAWLTQDSLPEGAALGAAPVESPLPVRADFGYAWTTVGDPPGELFDIPETAEPDRRTFNAGTFGIHTSPPRAVENFLDMGHLPFVHSGLLGEQPFTEIVDYRVEYQDLEIYAVDCLIFQPMATAASVSGQMVNYTFRVPHPLCALLYKTTPTDEARLDVIGLFVHPLRADYIRAHLFNSLLDATNSDGEIRRFQQSVIAQDKPILENQVPKRLPLDPEAEVPARSDKTSGAYRRWLGELGLTYGVIR
ncbi:MAG: aromatic ring-hydroxylating dioxygenase subunit alpha [bacterium]|nr:aromatic ring-hydroxylating dioxygenase subunit alpha [bacterium]